MLIINIPVLHGCLEVSLLNIKHVYNQQLYKRDKLLCQSSFATCMYVLVTVKTSNSSYAIAFMSQRMVSPLILNKTEIVIAVQNYEVYQYLYAYFRLVHFGP